MLVSPLNFRNSIKLLYNSTREGGRKTIDKRSQTVISIYIDKHTHKYMLN